MLQLTEIETALRVPGAHDAIVAWRECVARAHRRRRLRMGPPASVPRLVAALAALSLCAITLSALVALPALLSFDRVDVYAATATVAMHPDARERSPAPAAIERTNPRAPRAHPA